MLLLMLVSLYTSRVTLNTLGIDDFGIYGVVGGVVAMFSLISGSLTAAVSRFITFELGDRDGGRLNQVFSSALNIQIGLALVVFLLAETAGLWFLKTKLVIPADRQAAADWVYQFSILSFCLSLVMVPYNSSIIAHEKMSAFAYISIYDAFGKLAIAYLITVAPIDRLVWYAGLLLAMTLSTQLIYFLYCKRHFSECSYHFVFDGSLLKKMAGFAGWNFVGSSAAILRDQGGNIVINLFCGPSANAARAIAVQVNGAVSGFVSNFQTALNPQITKTYAAGEYRYMLTLIFQGARLSYFILLLLALPIILNAHYILTLWLGNVPEHATGFVQLTLLFALCEALSGPLITAMLATGNIRNYQLAVGGLNLLNLPLSYLCLRMGYPPESVMAVAVGISVLCLFARLFMLRPLIRLSARAFLRDICLNVLGVTLASAALPICAVALLPESFVTFVVVSFFTVLFTAASIYFLGCKAQEKLMIRAKAVQLLRKIHA